MEKNCKRKYLSKCSNKKQQIIYNGHIFYGKKKKTEQKHLSFKKKIF